MNRSMSKRLECFMKVPIGARLGYKTEPWNLNAYFLNIQFSLGQHFWRWRLGKLMNFSTAHFCGRKGRSHRQWLFVTLNLTTLHGFDENSWRRRATAHGTMPCHTCHIWQRARYFIWHIHADKWQNVLATHGRNERHGNYWFLSDSDSY